MQRDLNPQAVSLTETNSKTVGVRAVDVGRARTRFTFGRSDTASILTDSISSLASTTKRRQAGPIVSRQDVETITVDDLHFLIGEDAKNVVSPSELRSASECNQDAATHKALIYAALERMARRAGVYELVIERLVVGLSCKAIYKYGGLLSAWLLGSPHLIGANCGDASGARHRVVIRAVAVIPQPYGALLDFGIERRNGLDGWALVVDAGAGALNWSCSTMQQQHFYRSGTFPKAMLGCAFAVAGAIDKDLRDNLEVIERIDRAIRRVDGDGSFEVAGVKHNIADHWHRVEAVMHEAVDKMMARVGTTADLDLVLMTGCGAALFADAIRKHYPILANRIRQVEDPIYANVRGFHVYGERMLLERTAASDQTHLM